MKKNEPLEQYLVWLLKMSTPVSNEWIDEQLSLGDRRNITRAVAAVRVTRSKHMRSLRKRLGLTPSAAPSAALGVALCWSAGAMNAPGQGMNLARYGEARADSVAADAAFTPQRAVDGIVGDSSRWVSGAGPGPHWLEVALPDRFSIAGAHVFSGAASADPLETFTLEYWDGTGWTAIPGGAVGDNTESQRRVPFTTPVQTDRVRLSTTDDVPMSVSELAIFPAGGARRLPIDAGVELDVALTPIVTARSQRDSGTRPFLATDGIVSSESAWTSGQGSGPHWLELEFNLPRTIGSVHLYGVVSGETPGQAVPFHLEHRTGSADWGPVPGAAGEGLGAGLTRLDFPALTAGAVRVVVDGAGPVSIGEIVLLPPNEEGSYPAGTAVRIDPPPPASFEAFADNVYTIVNEATGVPIRDGTHYYLLNLYGTPFYRIVNRETGLCLEVSGASREPGAAVRDGRYQALDYQLWTLDANGDAYTIENLHSGLVLSPADMGLCQQSPGDDPARRWNVVFQSRYPKKGLAEMGPGRKMIDQRIAHYYNWGIVPGGGMPDGIHHQPMQWGDREWEAMALRQAEWAATAGPVFLLGFNEPDRPDQSRMSPEDVVRLWSRLEAVELPLVSPAPSWWNNGWAGRFFALARETGLRYDRVGIHVYITGGPDVEQFMEICDAATREYGRPVWNTEWNIVDWGGPASWTANELYTWLAEVLYRMELDPNVDRFHFFPFSPTWPNGAPGALWSDGVTMTPVGRLYGAWDGDPEIHVGAWYYLHHRDTHQRLEAPPEADAPVLTAIDNILPSTQWVLLPAGDDQYYIVAREGGRRLEARGSRLTLAPQDTTALSARWRFRPYRHGWYFVEHEPSARRLQVVDGALSLCAIAPEDDRDALLWRPIRPYNPGASVGETDTIPPGTPHEVDVVEGFNIMRVGWKNAGAPSDLKSYRLFRAEDEDGAFALLAENLTATSYVDTDVENGRLYRYRVTCVDQDGNESESSEAGSGMPANWAKVDDASPAVEYTGRWGTYSGNPGFMGTEHFTESEGAAATLAFEGSRIRFYGYKRYDLGTMDIILDGAHVESVDCFGLIPQHEALLFEAGDLAPGPHTITVRSTGRQSPYSTGVEVIVDAFAYLQDGPDTAPPGIPSGVRVEAENRRLTLRWEANTEADVMSYTVSRRAPAEDWLVLADELSDIHYVDADVENGREYAYTVRCTDASGNVSEPSAPAIGIPGVLTRLDDDDSAIVYSEGWGTYEGNPGYLRTEHFAETRDATATLEFTGTRVRCYGHKRDDLGIAEILLDGTPISEVDCFWRTSSYGQLLYESDNLPLGEHTLTIRVTGRQQPRSTGFEIIVDALEYAAPDAEP